MSITIGQAARQIRERLGLGLKGMSDVLGGGEPSLAGKVWSIIEEREIADIEVYAIEILSKRLGVDLYVYCWSMNMQNEANEPDPEMRVVASRYLHLANQRLDRLKAELESEHGD